MFNLYEVFPDPAPQLAVVDVGAASMGPGTDAYHALLGHENVRVIGFEPNRQACAELNAKAQLRCAYLPYFVGDGAEHTFYSCVNPLTSSLYEPNNELLDRFQNMTLGVLERSPVKTVRLDDIQEISDCDFLKLDIQGAELDAINGAARLLEKTVVVHTEVEFIPMYKGQALFGDIDVALRRHGFLLHKFHGLFSRQMKPLIFNNDPFSPFNQLVFAEAAVYVRDFTRFGEMSPTKLKNLASILHFVYGSYDLCAQALEEVDRREGSGIYQRYLSRLTGQPAPMPAV